MNMLVQQKTHSLVACTDTERALFNASYFSRTVVTHISSGSVAKYQNIEDITKLAGKTVTLSFWAKANSNKNISVSFAQVFGTGGSPSAVVTNIGAWLIALTTTWQKFTKTVTIPSIVGKTIGSNPNSSYTHVRFTFDDLTLNQSGTFDIAQVQLEEGSVATPFEQRPVVLELSLCQRYYEKVKSQPTLGAAGIYDGNQTIAMFVFKVLKRVMPSVNSVGSHVIIPQRIYHGLAVAKGNNLDANEYELSVDAEI